MLQIVPISFVPVLHAPSILLFLAQCSLILISWACTRPFFAPWPIMPEFISEISIFSGADMIPHEADREYNEKNSRKYADSTMVMVQFSYFALEVTFLLKVLHNLQVNLVV